MFIQIHKLTKLLVIYTLRSLGNEYAASRQPYYICASAFPLGAYKTFNFNEN